jgi:hypothetical protein
LSVVVVVRKRGLFFLWIPVRGRGRVIPIGYLAKRSVKRPEGLGDKMPQIADIYSVSSHVNDDFVDYIEFWKHNGYWLFDSPKLIREINSHSLFATVEEALQSLDAGAFSAGEPGPYRIFAVYTVDWPPL